MAVLTADWPMTKATVSQTQVNDVVGTAHLTLDAGQAINYCEGQVKGSIRGYLSCNFRGLAGGTDTSLSGLLATVVDSGLNCSISLLLRVHGAVTCTILRFAGTGGRYLSLYGTGLICLNGSNTYTVVPVASYTFGTWVRLTLVRSGSTTKVWLDNTALTDLGTLGFAMPAGAFYLFEYDGTFIQPPPVDIAGIRCYSDNLIQADIDALCVADGINPAIWTAYNDGSSFGAHSPNLEVEYLTPAGNTYNNLGVYNGANVIKYTSNGNGCRNGRQVGVPNLAEVYTYSTHLIPTGALYDELGTSPGPGYMLVQLQSNVNLTSAAADQIVAVEAQHQSGVINRWKVTWWNAANAPTVVLMTGNGTALPVDRLFAVELYIKYNGAASTITILIDGIQVANIVNADFTAKPAMRIAGFGLWQGTHVQAYDINTAPNNYFSIGKSYVGQARYSENLIKRSHKRRLISTFETLCAQ